MFISEIQITNLRNVLGNLFRVREGEGKKLALFWVPSFLILCANYFAWSVVQSAFIARFGAENMPYLFLASSTSILCGSLIAARLIARSRKTTVAHIFVGTSVVLLLSGWYLLDQHPFGEAFDALGVALTLVGNSAFLSFVSTIIWTTANDVFSSSQAKRLFPLLTISGTASGVLSGAALQWVTPIFGATGMLIPAAICMAASAPFFFLIQHRFVRELDWHLAFSHGKSARGSIRRMFQTAFSSRFILALAGVVLIYWFLNRIFGYLFVSAVDQAYPTEEGFMQFSGLYLMAYSIGSICFDAFLLNRLLERIGLTRGMFLTSNVVTVVSLAMFAFPIFPAILLASYVRDVILSVQNNSLQVMFGALSDEVRPRASAFIDGTVTTVGGVIGSVLVIAMQRLLLQDAPFSTEVQAFALVIILLLLARFGLNFYLRREFIRSLQRELIHGDVRTKLRAIETLVEHKYLRTGGISLLIDTARSSSEPIAVRAQAIAVLGRITDPTTLRAIMDELHSVELPIRLAAARALGEFRLTSAQFYQVAFSRHRAIEELRALFERESDPLTRAAALDALIHLEDDAIVPFLLKLLKNPDRETRRACLHSLRLFRDPAIIDAVRPMLSDKDAVARNYAIVALWSFDWERARLLPVLRELLPVSKEAEYVKLSTSAQETFRIGVKTIGDVKASEFESMLKQALHWRHAPDIRFESALSLFKMGRADGERVVRQMLESVDRDAIARIRSIAHSRQLDHESGIQLQELVEQAHLQFPRGTPSVESLDAPLSLIPEPCLQVLLDLYVEAGEEDEAKKLRAARAKKHTLTRPRGTVTIIEHDDALRRLYAIALLTAGYSIEYGVRLPGRASPSQAFLLDEGGNRIPDLQEYDPSIRHRTVRVIGRAEVDAHERRVVRRHHLSASEIIAAVDECFRGTHTA